MERAVRDQELYTFLSEQSINLGDFLSRHKNTHLENERILSDLLSEIKTNFRNSEAERKTCFKRKLKKLSKRILRKIKTASLQKSTEESNSSSESVSDETQQQQQQQQCSDSDT